MRTAALVVVWVAFAAASTVRFAAVPRSITLPATGASLRTSEIAQLNEVLLGLSTKPVTTFPVETELFSAPRALAVIDVAGVDDLNVKGQSYGVDVDGYDMVSLEGSVALNFGADRETVAVNGKGATGSQLAQTVAETTVDETLVKTKFEPLRSELIQVYKLVAALNSQAAKLSKTSSPDIFRVSIRGLLSITGSADEINMASHEVQKAVDALTAALNNAYGGQAIVEVICESRAVQDKENTTEHRITKRDVAVSDTQKLRNMYNVSVFTSPDYPAIFAIFAGLAIILAIAVLYIAVGIWNMDPGRDSIIYRMTTTRMKKD